MKARYLFLFMLAALGLTGCQEKVVVNNFHTDTIDLLVRQSEWEYDKDAQQFFCHKDIPDITSEVYDLGEWSIHREFLKGSKYAYQVALPMSMFMTDTLSNKSVVYYTQYLDYRLGVGYVEIQLTNSDYLYTTDAEGYLKQPEAMEFRLQLMY